MSVANACVSLDHTVHSTSLSKNNTQRPNTHNVMKHRDFFQKLSFSCQISLILLKFLNFVATQEIPILENQTPKTNIKHKTPPIHYCSDQTKRHLPDFTQDKSNNLYYECKCISSTKFDCELSQKYRSLVFIDGQNIDRIKLQKRENGGRFASDRFASDRFASGRSASGQFGQFSRNNENKTITSVDLFHKQTIIPNLSGTPYNLAIDPGLNVLFFTDTSLEQHGLFKVNLQDGLNLQRIVLENSIQVYKPTGISLDVNSKRIYKVVWLKLHGKGRKRLEMTLFEPENTPFHTEMA